MKIIQLLEAETEVPKGRIITAAVVSGVANGLLLAVLNQSAAMAAAGRFEIRFLLLFSVIFMLFVGTKRYAVSRSTIIVEGVVRRIRIRMIDKVRRCDLIKIEELGGAEIYAKVTNDTRIVSQVAPFLINAAQSVIVLLFCFLYISWLSFPIFLIASGAIVLAVIVYLANYKNIIEKYGEAQKKEVEFFEYLAHILDGFKEIKMNRRKSDDLFDVVQAISLKAEALNVDAGLKLITKSMFSQMFFYLLIGVVVFIAPMYDKEQSLVVVKVVSSLLFIVGPLEVVVGAIPTFAVANISAGNIMHLDQLLDSLQRREVVQVETGKDHYKPMEFKDKIELKECSFQYGHSEGKGSFSVGPINLEIRKGEILFIVGGNGSGKSTLLKLLSGLYHPHSGVLLVDGDLVDHYSYESYRELFSVIFTDFHLFDRLYGVTIDDIVEKEVKGLLRAMELDYKTKYLSGRFTNLNLSTGQRKRLAYIVALLENKSILIFDEWAADQDPIFRRRFYEEFLEGLREQGKTIIAVTHDEHYFDKTKHRVIRMVEGQMRA